MLAYNLIDFITESNEIEGIENDNISEVLAHKAFLEEPLTVPSIEQFVYIIQPGAKLRDKPNMDVVVGRTYYPPRGGPHIYFGLTEILDKFYELSPWKLYCEYETLHPFMDGNGRSGRALWLKRMGGIEKAPMGFLKTFHIQSLQESRK